MKLGGSIAAPYATMEEWGERLRESRFAAVTCPLSHGAKEDQVAEMLKAAQSMNVTIAEVGVWRNPLARDAGERASALQFAKNQLAFADEIGANCCVNIVGSKGEKWDGAYRDNYSPETYQEVVRSIREIIDAVNPKKTFYTIEPMPWMVPDGPDAYLRLLKDVDRERFAVHMDFVNMINSVKRFLFAEEFIEECFQKLHPMIKSCHIKDVLFEEPFTTILREVPPGKGHLNYGSLLRIIDKYLGEDAPVLLEHMSTAEEYAEAYDYVAGIAARENITVK